MKLLSLSPQNNGSRKAIFWALLSQTIWLPVFVTGSHDELSSNGKYSNQSSRAERQRHSLMETPFSASMNTLGSRTQQLQSRTQVGRQNTGIILNTLFPGQPRTHQDTQKPSPSSASLIRSSIESISSDSNQPPGSTASYSRHQLLALQPSRPGIFSNTSLIRRMYSRSEMLGGTLTLQDLNEPIMPPLARAERIQWSRSGDPLAPLPQIWREPMRKALNSLSQTGMASPDDISVPSIEKFRIDPARFVHVPSTRIRRASEIPLALQADGSVDILNQPDDPVIIDEINRWSAKQKLPEKGKISPAVVHLHPMEPLGVGRNSSENKQNGGVATSQQQPTSPPATSPLAAPPESSAVATPRSTDNHVEAPPSVGEMGSAPTRTIEPRSMDSMTITSPSEADT